MKVAEPDVKHLGRFVPFVMRHRALLRYWTAARRQHVRALLPDKVQQLCAAATKSFMAGSAPPGAATAAATSGAAATTVGGGDGGDADFGPRHPSEGNFGSEVSMTATGPRRSASVRLSTRIRSARSLGRVHRFPILVPQDKLDRIVRQSMEEFRGLCIDAVYRAARIAVRGGMGPDEYATVRDALLDEIGKPQRAGAGTGGGGALRKSVVLAIVPGGAGGGSDGGDAAAAAKRRASIQRKLRENEELLAGIDGAGGGRLAVAPVSAREAYTVRQLLSHGLAVFHPADGLAAPRQASDDLLAALVGPP